MSRGMKILVGVSLLVLLLIIGLELYRNNKPQLPHPSPTPISTPVSTPVGTTQTPDSGIGSTTPNASGLVGQVKIYLVASEDQGKSGPKIGCGDSIVYTTQSITPTKAPLKAALQSLLAIKDQYVGKSALYNSLYQAKLTVGTVTIEDGAATINLTGSLSLGGVCDNPRVLEQLRYTALQFDTVKTVQIFLNGKRLEDVLSEK